jgi:hypothetical protein
MSSKVGSSQLSIRSGFRSAICWGVVGAVAALVVVAVLQANERWQDLTMLGEYRSWLHSSIYKSSWPAIGCATVLACSAWAANALQPPRSLAVCLLLIASPSIVLWYVLFALEVTPRRLKGVEHPAIYFSEFLVLIIPPLVVAGLSTWASSHARRQPGQESDLPFHRD